MPSLNKGSFAAVDLGSNSFHMLVAQLMGERLQVVARMTELVRLAGGLDERNLLTEEVMARAVDCLRRFGQRLRGVPPGNVRVVGTNTLRKARNRAQFLAWAEQALGHSIDIIAGREEARLIYLGVSHSLEDSGEQRLVVDIGGGSTELILGQKFRPVEMESLFMGCVGMSKTFFKDGVIDGARMQAAEMAAMQELETLTALYRKIGWESAIGSSGTILAIQEVASNQGWSKDGISIGALRKLRKALIEAGHVDKFSLAGLQRERAPVFPGGVAILIAVFDSLGLDRMRVANGALREGLLYDLLGRIHHEDVRERTVEEVMRRYQVDVDQARHVELTAMALLNQAAAPWGIVGEEYEQLLRWAARLHEIGLMISHGQYHKHGAYLVKNMDMPGFSEREQSLLSALIRGHRRKLALEEFAGLGEDIAETARRLCLLLRLAVALHRSRSGTPLPPLGMEVDGAAIRLRFTTGWLEEHPLTRADLEQEADYLKMAGSKFKVKFK
jgi:exopolyphosphatase/guanosine-5'-triphosphate,3'-diphosphate pyrophosphatase